MCAQNSRSSRPPDRLAQSLVCRAFGHRQAGLWDPSLVTVSVTVRYPQRQPMDALRAREAACRQDDDPETSGRMHCAGPSGRRIGHPARAARTRRSEPPRRVQKDASRIRRLGANVHPVDPRRSEPELSASLIPKVCGQAESPGDCATAEKQGDGASLCRALMDARRVDGTTPRQLRYLAGASNAPCTAAETSDAVVSTRASTSAASLP